METLPWLEEAAHSLFVAIGADPDLGNEEKRQVRAGLRLEVLEAALNRGIGWAIEHLPDLWEVKRRGGRREGLSWRKGS